MALPLSQSGRHLAFYFIDYIVSIILLFAEEKFYFFTTLLVVYLKISDTVTASGPSKNMAGDTGL